MNENIYNKDFEDMAKKLIKENIFRFEKELKHMFKDSSDLVTRIIKTKKGNILILYIDGLVNNNLIDRDIINELFLIEKNQKIENKITVSEIKKNGINLSFVNDVLDGNIALFCETEEEIVIASLKDWKARPVESPDIENTIRGPKESFNEVLRTNTSLIRRKIKNKNLVFQKIKLGKETNTDVCICYIDGIVNTDVLKELKLRLSKINTDVMLETGYIEQYIEDRPLLTLPTVGSTQKPDVAAAKILEGRIAILCDGTPNVATVPHVFIENLQTSEDYYHRPYLATFFRLLRFIGLGISILLPALYVAVATYHQEMIPSPLLGTIASSTIYVPFPKGIECLAMLLIFEILRESGTRLPKNIGSAVSIMGGLVIGDAAVNAGFVGAPMVIIIALTALSSFIFPNLTEFMVVNRFIFVALSMVMGLIGVLSGVMIVLAQLCSTESFGVSYLTVRNSNGNIRDFLVRFPLKYLNYKPSRISNNKKR